MQQASHPWEITEYRGLAGLTAVEPAWRDLYRRMPDPSPWHLFEAFSCYARQLCPDPDSLRLLVLMDGVRARAILPVEERIDHSLGIPLRVWGLCAHEHWRPTDAIGPEDDARLALIPAVLAHLRSVAGRPSLFVLGSTHAASVVWEGFDTVPGSHSFCDGYEARFATDISFDDFANRMERSWRKQLGTKRRKLERVGEVRVVRARTPEELEAGFAHLLRVEGSGWKGEQGTAIQQHPRLVAYYRDLVTSAYAEGHAEIHLLYVGDFCVAASLNLFATNGFGGLKSGYDEAYRRFAPGLLLAHQSFEMACADPRLLWVSGMSEAPWTHRWVPARNTLRRGYAPLDVWGHVLVALLRLRFGPVRRMARAAATRRAASGDAASTGEE